MRKYRIRFLQAFFAFLTLVGLYVFDPLGILIAFLLYFLLETFVGNATLHRYYGHRSFVMNKKFEPTLRWLAHHIGVGSVLGWAGHHRWHHQYSDTDKDLHSPTKQGIPHILFGIWDANIPRSMVKDLLKDNNLLWWHKNYFTYHLSVIILLTVISPWALIYIYGMPNLMSLLSGYIIAILPHKTGEVKNDFITELLTFGEGGHLNHHNNPQNYRFSKNDITANIIEKYLMRASNEL